MMSVVDMQSIKSVSRCFKSTELSFVTLYCGYQHFIKIERAIHGHRQVLSVLSYCHQLPTDCTTDVTGHYDWSACDDQRHCVHSLRQFNDTAHKQRCLVNQPLTYLQVGLHCCRFLLSQ